MLDATNEKISMASSFAEHIQKDLEDGIEPLTSTELTALIIETEKLATLLKEARLNEYGF